MNIQINAFSSVSLWGRANAGPERRISNVLE